ncbi:MAG: hypothetical protein A3F84_29800 [Candidatus Handelsmanbacteria bacterium RIFCSPLOWO2_12_FULL_64_10]|uniref:Uncharacterized protein n=1 Tax=Handelsmanbacteria sp. (strain RIFCSPLOWO2_12_FULL_64_10) TaxID=1817868 RepID=A0A1F6C2J5_HANXR|nr:MAG: hypothetical protein A3F84_29800 [Candidatus Handelsmanbacteria bacterium RIFCSPLOWO2_12_FULL_64_10]
MSSECAKSRGDLVVSRQDTPEAVTFVVKDPATGRFFRFRETEAFILQQLDGATPLDLLCHTVEQRFGATLPPQTLEQFVGRLRNLGLLEQAEGGPVSLHRPHGRVRGNFLYLRLKAIDPDRLLGRLVRRLRFFFTPYFVFFSAACVLLALYITVADWPEIEAQFRRLFRFQSLLLAWAVVLCVVTMHEFAHGLTCKHFGGEVREMGFMLIYFQPAFYCNVSDAWLFPEKYKRLWVTFAGAYFEVFLWAIATWTWRMTDPYTVLNYVAMVVMATSGVKTMFNLNPLIKLDGYYLLSDFLEIPNLRGKAVGYLGDRVRRLWGGAQRIGEAPPRERRIYLVYGLLAWTYSWWLLSYVALWFGGYLVGQYQGWGFILFLAILAGIFQSPLKKFSQAASSSLRLSGIVSPLKGPIRTFAVLGVLLTVLFLCRMELRVSGPFVVLPVHNADVRAVVEGIIEEIYVKEGDVIDRGAPIARLSDRDCRTELRKIEAEIAEKRAQLKLLRAGPRQEEIDLAKTFVVKAEERLKYARSQLDMRNALFKRQFISRKDFEETEELVAVREKELEEAEHRLRVLLAGSRPEEVEAAEAEISRLKAQQRHLEEQLKALTVVSPIAGVVTTHRLKEKIGQNVGKGDLIADVHDLTTVTVEISVPEKEIADVRVGQEVALKARAYPQASFHGTVASIAPTVTRQENGMGENAILVITQIDNASLLLKPDMSGNAKVSCGRQRLIDLVTRRFVRFIRVEFWSWW